MGTVDVPCDDTCTAYVELKLHSNVEPTGARICCNAPTTLLYSDTNMVLVLYRSGSTIDSGYKGWTLQYKSGKFKD
jgi:hypothetical protein